MELFEPIINNTVFKNAVYEAHDKEGNWGYGQVIQTVNEQLGNCMNDEFHQGFIALCRKYKITYQGYQFQNKAGEYSYKIIIYKDGYDSYNTEYSDKKKDVSRELALTLQKLLKVQLSNREVIDEIKKDRL